MSLMRGRLFAGALYSGALFGVEQAQPEAPAEQVRASGRRIPARQGKRLRRMRHEDEDILILMH